jgi:hypothetical protein
MAAFNVRLTEADKLSLDIIVKNAGMTQAEFLRHIIHLYETLGMGGLGLGGNDIKPNTLNPSQISTLEKAVSITGGTIEHFMIDASMAKAETVLKLSTYTDEELKKVPNSANVRINSAVLELMDANKKAVDWYEKVEVTQGRIAEITGSNRGAIRKYFAENQGMIKAHNDSLGLYPNHNTKAAVHLLQQRKGEK